MGRTVGGTLFKCAETERSSLAVIACSFARHGGAPVMMTHSRSIDSMAREGAVEIVPGVHDIRVIGATVHLLVEDELTLIDTGRRGSGAHVARYIETLGRPMSDLTRIVCTHGHPDHIGGVAEIVAASGATVHMHPADAERLRIGVRDVLARPSPGPLIALLTRPLSDPQPIGEGDVLPPLGGLRVIHTPGHTPGSVCLYAPARRILFSGDALQFRRGRLSRPHLIFSDDMAEARRSVARLAALEVDVICFAHYAPLRSGVGGALHELLESWA